MLLLLADEKSLTMKRNLLFFLEPGTEYFNMPLEHIPNILEHRIMQINPW